MNADESTAKTLAPCPFCGSKPWGVLGPCEHSGRMWVECAGAGNDCMTCGDWYPTDTVTTREQVVEAWNQRAIQPALAERDRIFKVLQTHIAQCRKHGRLAEADRNLRVLEMLRRAPLS